MLLRAFGASIGSFALSVMIFRGGWRRVGLAIVLLTSSGIAAAVAAILVLAAPALTAVTAACFFIAYRARFQRWSCC